VSNRPRRFSITHRARLSAASVAVLAALALAVSACGGGGDATPVDAGTPLSSLLSGFGPGAGLPGSGDRGTGGTHEVDGGMLPEEAVPACDAFCGLLLDCLPTGCPNFARLSPSTRDGFGATCVRDCAGMTSEQVEEIRSYGCEAIAAELTKDPGLAAFCALKPASPADCDRACEQLGTCGAPVNEAFCNGICFYGEGIACILENENGCDFDACSAHFPEQ